MVSAIAELLGGVGLIPVLAHPERCRAVRRDVVALTDAQAKGALVQVVSTSLRGVWGSEIERAAWLLVASGRADMIASDAHRATDADDALRGVLDTIQHRLGMDERRRLTVDRPGELLGRPAG
jgi:protein-tyrosine phosphatase